MRSLGESLFYQAGKERLSKKREQSLLFSNYLESLPEGAADFSAAPYLGADKRLYLHHDFWPIISQCCRFVLL